MRQCIRFLSWPMTLENKTSYKCLYIMSLNWPTLCDFIFQHLKKINHCILTFHAFDIICHQLGNGLYFQYNISVQFSTGILQIHTCCQILKYIHSISQVLAFTSCRCCCSGCFSRVSSCALVIVQHCTCYACQYTRNFFAFLLFVCFGFFNKHL